MARAFGGTGSQFDGMDQFDRRSANMYAAQGMMSPGQESSRRGKSIVDDTSNYGYAPKSKLLYQAKRSKTGQKSTTSKAPSQIGPYTGDTKS